MAKGIGRENRGAPGEARASMNPQPRGADATRYGAGTFTGVRTTGKALSLLSDPRPSRVGTLV